MAAALYPAQGTSSPSMNQVNPMPPRNFLNDFDVDNRYPNTSNIRLSTSSPHMRPPQTSSLPYTDYDSSPLQPPSSSYADPSYMVPQWSSQNSGATPGSSSRPSNDEDPRNSYFSTRDDVAADTQARQTPPVRQQPSFPRDSSSSFQGNNRTSMMERQYSADEEDARGPSRNAGDSRSVSTYVESRPQPQRPTSSSQPQQNYDRPTSLFVPPTSTPKASMAAYGDNGRPYSQAPAPSPYPAIQTAPKYRAYAPQPAYSGTPNAAVPVFTTTPQQPQEETCVECAMRDQDMADVDVTSPGVWDRESDIHFHELARLEHEEEMNGITNPDPSRPRAKGGRLTEQNLRIWLSVNPREPASRKQTLEKYIRSQITLLEAEALAHARAMQEAKQLDNRMRDAYSQLRRSAYDTGNSATAADDMGGVRIKPPSSPNEATHPIHTRGHSRDVTLLENGMIVEHVDVRKEEKEARDRQRKEERRARKASRSSTLDVTSVYSTASQSTPMFDSPMTSPDLRHLPVGPSGRPTSVLTAPMERPRIPRASSQASFSDVHSLGSLSPRRTRFFGFKNLSGGFRSQDSLAPSGYTGSMVDMHVALQREEQRRGVQDTVSPLRRSQVWPPPDATAEDGDSSRVTPEGKGSKSKKRGLRKIWSIVTGSKNNNNSRVEPRPSISQPLDDVPLAPPPPLSYLVNRAAPGEASSARHSTASLHSTLGSPRLMTPGVSPPTAPSSLLPSPSSSRPDVEAELRKGQGGPPFVEEPEQIAEFQPLRRNDSRGRRSQMGMVSPAQAARPMSAISRDKSLPPLPIEGQQQPLLRPATSYQQEIRPRTMYTYDPRTLPRGASPPCTDFLPPQAPFRTENVRRQSFGGITNRPSLHLQTMPPINGTPERKSFGIRYDEFGSSRRSLGPFDISAHDHTMPSTTTKRKSRFGLVSLFAKKAPAQAQESLGNHLHQFPSTRSGSSGDDDTMHMGNTAYSRNSVAPRTSMISVSRKVEDLIPQDPEFVAYRYPSNDQEFNLLR